MPEPSLASGMCGCEVPFPPPRLGSPPIHSLSVSLSLVSVCVFLSRLRVCVSSCVRTCCTKKIKQGTNYSGVVMFFSGSLG